MSIFDSKKCDICRKQMELKKYKVHGHEFQAWVRSCHCVEDREKNEVELKRYETLLSDSNLPKRCIENDYVIPVESDVRFTGDDLESMLEYRKFIIAKDDSNYIINNFSGIFILGTPGTRKTSYICEVAKAWMKRGLSCLYFQCVEIFHKKISIYDLMDIDLLILDDMGMDNFEKKDGMIFTLVNKRMETRKTTAIISNFGEDHLRAMFGDAFIDRMKLFYKIPMIGASSRLEIQQ